jgi:hypothetical protein
VATIRVTREQQQTLLQAVDISVSVIRSLVKSTSPDRFDADHMCRLHARLQQLEKLRYVIEKGRDC